MATSSCVSVGEELPVVTGFLSKKEELLPGNTLPQILPALRLIDSAARIVPDMRFTRISLNNPAYFQAGIRLDSVKRNYKLYLSRKKVEVQLRSLEKLLSRVSSSHPNATVIDMRYKGQAVIK